MSDKIKAMNKYLWIHLFVTLFVSVRSAEIVLIEQESNTTMSDFEIKALRTSQKIIHISELYSPEGIRKNRLSNSMSESLIDTKAMIDGVKKVTQKKGQEYTACLVDFILHHSLSPINQIFPPVSCLRKITLLNALQVGGYVSEKAYLEHYALLECYQQMVDHKTVPESIIMQALQLGVDPRNLLLSLHDKATSFWCQVVQMVHPGWLIGIARKMLLQELPPRSNKEMVFKNYVGAIAKNSFVFGYAQLLLASIKENNVNATQILIDAGANVNAEDVDGDTLLHEAARKGYSQQIALLLAAGARVKQNKHHTTPQDLVKKNDACLKLFKEN